MPDRMGNQRTAGSVFPPILVLGDKKCSGFYSPGRVMAKNLSIREQWTFPTRFQPDRLLGDIPKGSNQLLIDFQSLTLIFLGRHTAIVAPVSGAVKRIHFNKRKEPHKIG